MENKNLKENVEKAAMEIEIAELKHKIAKLKLELEENKTLNLNDNIEIKLTEDGKIIYGKYYDENYEEIPDEMRIQIWQFCSIFGEKLMIGSHPVTKENKIKLNK